MLMKKTILFAPGMAALIIGCTPTDKVSTDPIDQ